MNAYYNENEPFAAQWLRELIKSGLIADGEVDERSIELVRPDDLRGFVQCHFFAGIGGWSYALRLAGWPDDRAVWTGSCPCQPFSSAGTQTGGHDPRDLWPAWFQLIGECRPGVVFGEQVESAIAHGWLDRVCDDMEDEEYAVGSVGLPAASVGAYHIRHRLWFVADAKGPDQRRYGGEPRIETGARGSEAWPQDGHAAGSTGAVGELAHADGRRCQESHVHVRPTRFHEATAIERWIPCADGKARPIEPSLEPVADGIPARVGRLRGYGNAIVPPLAAEFIKAYREAVGEDLHGL